ncbi:MAG TPA: hypothetical protein ENG87_05415 [Candidatus Pacearchaeota archaeon]|nr:hypothetical protein [Candidatus Pacearchaeota archaeon]
MSKIIIELDGIRASLEREEIDNEPFYLADFLEQMVIPCLLGVGYQQTNIEKYIKLGGKKWMKD